MSLSTYLKRVGLTTGPTAEPTGHTRLGFVKTMLLGAHVTFTVSKTFQEFGKYVHESLFLGKTKIKLSPEDKKRADAMLKALRANKTVMKLLEDCVVETMGKAILAGVNIEYTPDAVQRKKKGRDLKTTICANENDFVKKGFEYGYFRQDVTYSAAAGLDEFVIIGIQKDKPYRVFIVVTSLHPELRAYAAKELEFLLYFYKNYGNFIALTTWVRN